MKLLDDEEWRRRSSGEIAKHCVVSADLVDNIKAERSNTSVSGSIKLEEAPPLAPAEKTVTYTHPKTGKPTQMSTAASPARS
jgi:hypothetical protein